MQFGIREICDVVFKAKSTGKVGSMPVRPGQPVLYIDSAKTSTMEGAATTVYAQGGKGNTRLIAWEGERTLTFTVEDALLSELGFAILSGAGLFDKTSSESYVHQTAKGIVENGEIDLTPMDPDEYFSIAAKAPIYAMVMEHGSFSPTGLIEGLTPNGMTLTGDALQDLNGKDVFVDFYVLKTTGVTEMTIDMENFGGYYYVEASTLFRRQSDGKDLPAELIFPNVKVQSNFTFTMASTGDPSTFTFTMDAMPGYTRFDRKKKVLCAMQVIDEDKENEEERLDSGQTPALEEAEYPYNGKATAVVSFKSNDGTVEVTKITSIKEEQINLPVLQNTETKTFAGWATVVDSAVSDVESPYTVTADTTLFAVFTAKE